MLCDLCKGKVHRRHDDDPQTHKERLRAYHDKTEPLVDFYRRAGVLVEINGDQSIEQVAEEIARTIERRK
jgi:adenylate kinase